MEVTWLSNAASKQARGRAGACPRCLCCLLGWCGPGQEAASLTIPGLGCDCSSGDLMWFPLTNAWWGCLALSNATLVRIPWRATGPTGTFQQRVSSQEAPKANWASEGPVCSRGLWPKAALSYFPINFSDHRASVYCVCPACCLTLSWEDRVRRTREWHVLILERCFQSIQANFSSKVMLSFGKSINKDCSLKRPQWPFVEHLLYPVQNP